MAQNINWWKVGIFIMRIAIALFVLNLGYVNYSEAGERTYNKYLHALRKMYLPSSKPSDNAFAGLTFDEANKNLIKVIGIVQMMAGILILIG